MNKLKTAHARLIGGSHAGEVHVIEPKQQVLRLLSMENARFPIEAEVRGESYAVPYEDYRIERLRYGSGHEHVYGVLDRIPMVSAMNALWDAYEDHIKRLCPHGVERGVCLKCGRVVGR